MLGTAPQATVWVAVEQAGPWGPRPLLQPADSHLPNVLRAVLAAVDAQPSVKVLLLRRTGRHADSATTRRDRQVVLARVAPGRRFVTVATCRSDDDVVDLDLAGSASAALDGTPPSWGRPVEHPLALVCTNGRRDRCCALAGRPLAAEAAERHPGAVWECTHLGGHRFAPTALVLPAGAVYGRLDGARLTATMAELGQQRLPLAGLRGLTALSPTQQVADAAVRGALGRGALDATRAGAVVQEPDGAARVSVTSVEGDHHVRVRSVAGPSRPESCRKPSVARTDLVAELLPHAGAEPAHRSR
jgi:hypothetical protein